ncbi:MAG: DegT/DnrJ/EryC1/StrS family aminotransferase [bacterium]|nr:DegT/DnrJ/EryC1/StrS family aminotransferase [bacterium]
MDRAALLGGVPVRKKPFPAWPQSDGRDLKFLQGVLETSQWGGTIHGPKVQEICERYADFVDAGYGVGMASCTAGLELSLRAFDIGPGDEVIVPAYTFIATSLVPLMVGADVVFADMDPKTLCLTPEAIEAAVGPNTKAIIPVHFAGHAADVEGIQAVARKHGLKVIWDAAHAHTTEWRGKGVGGLGEVAVYSFNHAKNLTCGEGGMVTTNDEELADLLRYSLSTFGRKKGRPWYEHHRLGFSEPLTEFQGAILLGQFEQLDEQSRVREKNAELLIRGLSEIEGVDPPYISSDTTRHGWHVFMMTYHPEAFEGLPKELFKEALAAEGILTGGYGYPLYDNPMYIQETGKVVGAHSKFRKMPCPVSEWACSEGIFSISQSMLLDGPDGMNDIVNAIAKVKANAGDLLAQRKGE